jgi:hypothetical protein
MICLRESFNVESLKFGEGKRKRWVYALICARDVFDEMPGQGDLYNTPA